MSKSYRAGTRRITALRRASLTIDQGRFTVVLGPSGSGKSTLLNLLGGMDSATSGRIRVGDQLISSFRDRQLTEYRRLSVGFVFQFYNLVPNLTAMENVALAAALTTDRVSAEHRAHEGLERVGLGHRSGNFPGQLSGGEMQRVALARALAKRPALLLCDEPTGALDSKTGEQIMALLRETASDAGTAVVVVTHDQRIGRTADRLIRLHDGDLVAETA
ncbi:MULTISPECIES: ABC transporter ATP-binding protein [unclassified Rathayibacter]|uniref:ABC transporter ATP-binding protein n=1 Tax=unclassified Rathayibacter TaxID=2609250 RepID=UPI001FB3D07A|nr:MULTISPECIES: ABC transporter ATP-binding protein [unclassified Rathayibacter]MCJ1673901.1 ABC transporter ATP-binding protein [Rathayibacter sp. VKM Ac-2929]MCJ1683103.1 ABC transporter ATP-binding protein [Rathayibacter sp. VKM Ac-2928]MCJ1687980.1 ABC transporter ATP-binding protein [Rathayibacter sp. VKM Ac-2927]